MAQDQTHLVWLDMEMTGLDPDRDRIIEIAVIITDRGEPAFALLNIAEYRRLTQAHAPRQNMAELLAMPEADAYDFDPAPIRLEAGELGA